MLFSPDLKLDAFDPSICKSHRSVFSLKVRTSGFLIALIVILSSVLSAVFYSSASNMLTVELKHRGEVVAQSIAENVTYSLVLEDFGALNSVISSYLSNEDMAYILVFNRRGELLFPSQSKLKGKEINDVIYLEALRNGGLSSGFFSSTLD